MAIGSDAVANAVETYIKDMMIEPIAHNVPMHTVADVWKLPREGHVLRIPRAPAVDEATALDKDTAYILTNTTGEWDMSVPYDEYTVLEYGLFTRILKWAQFVTALDMAKQIGNRLIESGALTMNSLAYDALCGYTGLMASRVDGLTETACEEEFTVNSATGLATTGCRTNLDEADDWWNTAYMTYTSGPNRGLTRQITDFTNVNGVIVNAAFPQAPTNGDKGFVTILGAAAANLDSGNTMRLVEMYRAREKCLRHGAGGLGMEGEVLDVTGITKKRDGAIKQGVIFMPTKIVHELQVTLAGNATAQDGAYFQTSEGFRRAVGGTILNIGGLMVVPVNYYKQAAVADGTLTVGTGAAHPSVILYPHAFGCTVLKDNKGSRQGLDITVKSPPKRSIATMFDSIKYQGELDIVNKYFCANAVHGCVLWSGTALV